MVGGQPDDSLTLAFRAQLGVGVPGSFKKALGPFEFVLNVDWESLEEVAVGVDGGTAVLLGAQHLLEVVDLVYYVVV